MIKDKPVVIRGIEDKIKLKIKIRPNPIPIITPPHILYIILKNTSHIIIFAYDHKLQSRFIATLLELNP